LENVGDFGRINTILGYSHHAGVFGCKGTSPRRRARSSRLAARNRARSLAEKRHRGCRSGDPADFDVPGEAEQRAKRLGETLGKA
jgi:hypothetical protein